MDENSLNASHFMVDVVLWSICFSMISDKLLTNEQRFMSDQSTGWEGEIIGHVDPGNSSSAKLSHFHTYVITGSQYDHFASLMATTPPLRRCGEQI